MQMTKVNEEAEHVNITMINLVNEEAEHVLEI
jgi:hypothetical protein